MTDIEAQLAELHDLIAPYPGEWVKANVGQAEVVLAEDPPVHTSLVWDAPDGTVSIVDADDGTKVMVNTTLKAFVDCCRLYTAAADESERIDSECDDPDKADRLYEKLGQKLLKKFRKIDPAAVHDENDMWAVAAEEVGYGM